MPNVMKSGSLNLLEPFGPHRACNGTALPLPLLYSRVLPTKNGFVTPLTLDCRLTVEGATANCYIVVGNYGFVYAGVNGIFIVPLV